MILTHRLIESHNNPFLKQSKSFKYKPNVESEILGPKNKKIKQRSSPKKFSSINISPP